VCELPNGTISQGKTNPHISLLLASSSILLTYIFNFFDELILDRRSLSFGASELKAKIGTIRQSRPLRRRRKSWLDASIFIFFLP
jgi:hypothetical protein